MPTEKFGKKFGKKASWSAVVDHHKFSVTFGGFVSCQLSDVQYTSCAPDDGAQGSLNIEQESLVYVFMMTWLEGCCAQLQVVPL